MAPKTPQLVSGSLCCPGCVGCFACFHCLDLCPPLPNLWQELETFSLLSNGTPSGVTDQVGVTQNPKCFPNFIPVCLSLVISKSSGSGLQRPQTAPCLSPTHFLISKSNLIHKGQDWLQLWRSVRSPSRVEPPHEEDKTRATSVQETPESIEASSRQCLC